MEKFELHILGCGSALPTTKHVPTSQVLSLRDKLFMIDCGEGTQLQMRKSRLRFLRLGHIFISHLHGDHCFGLMGLISTFSLLGRTAPLHIHAPRELEGLMRPQLDFYCRGGSFEVVFHGFDPAVSECIFEDRSVSVTTIPLRHRLPCSGFLFEEKPGLPHIRRDMMDYLEIPVCEFNNIKLGADWVRPDGTVIPNERLVKPAEPARRFAYCSDTAFVPANAELVRGVDLLFHEATFGSADERRAAETFHSTAAQAAEFARLAGVRRLVIGHYSSRYDDEQQLLAESRAVFPDTSLACEGAVFSIGGE